MKLRITKSKRKIKNFDLLDQDKRYILSFGHSDYSDFTKHKDEERKERYINRHKNNEDHTKSGVKTAGFWARWVLWSEPTITTSINKLNKRFNLNIKLI